MFLFPPTPPPRAQPSASGTPVRVFGWNLEENVGVLISLGCPETPGLTKKGQGGEQKRRTSITLA